MAFETIKLMFGYDLLLKLIMYYVSMLRIWVITIGITWIGLKTNSQRRISLWMSKEEERREIVKLNVVIFDVYVVYVVRNVLETLVYVSVNILHLG